MKTEEFKNMSKVKKILTVAKYIIENEATVTQTALYFGISTSSVKKYINDDCNLKSLDNNIYLAVKEVQDRIQKMARIKGGENEKAKNELNLLSRKINDYEIRELMNKKHSELSEEEAEKIARFRLKYYYPVRRIKENFKLGQVMINKIEEELAQKDPIYSDKLDLLHYVHDQKRESFRTSKR